MGYTIMKFGEYAFDAYYWLILISIFGSWFPQFQASRVGMWIYGIVEPYLKMFRRFIPPLGPIDLSPLVALLVYRFLSAFALEGLRQSLLAIGV